MKRFFITLLAGIFLFPHIAETHPKETWQELASTPLKRTESSAALVDDKIYLLGGFTPKGISKKVDVWDPESGIWSQIPPLPRGLHHTTASVVNGKLYAIGGFDSGTWRPVNVNYEYDPEIHRWTSKTPMPTSRGALSAGVIDGKIHVVGGAHRKLIRLVNTPAHEVYDPETDTWETLAPMPTARDHLAVSVTGKKLFAIGGRINVDYKNNLDVNESYDVKTGTWSRHTPLPTARSGITSQVLNGLIHVFGGESGQKTFVENEAYDPSTDQWTIFKPMPSGRHGLASALWKNEIHILTGGPRPGGGGSDTHFVFKLN
jgi:N-acetylneuraminic acid mutarotase